MFGQKVGFKIIPVYLLKSITVLKIEIHVIKGKTIDKVGSKEVIASIC